MEPKMVEMWVFLMVVMTVELKAWRKDKLVMRMVVQMVVK
jgi:hypothetical protein